MPDNNGNNGTPNNGSATNNETSQLYTDRRSAQSGRTEMQILESIERQLGQIVQNGGNINNMSASNANNRYGRNGSTHFQDRLHRIGGNSYREFSRNFEKEFMENLFGSEFKRAMKDAGKKLAQNLGVEVEELPQELGKQLGKSLSNSLANTNLGRSILQPFNQWKSDIAKQINDVGVPTLTELAQGSIGAGEAMNACYRRSYHGIIPCSRWRNLCT